jgi:hypothetical protein
MDEGFMNESDFRDACAMLAMVGIIIRGNILSNKADDAKEAFAIADHMLKARNPEPEEGIVAIKKTRKVKE